MVEVNDETVLVAACADGAGSAEHSAIGSRLACEKIIHLIIRGLGDGVKIKGIDRDRILEWHREVIRDLEKEAQARCSIPRDLACTLLTAIVGEDCAAFSQIGDGAMVVFMEESYQVVFWPQSGEYVNTTNFLTDQEFEDRLEFRSRDGRVEEIALLTDGLQIIALDYAEKKAHDPFFSPLFGKVRESAGTDELELALREFLDSPRVNERTDDDKTLIVATRRSAHGTAPTV